MGGAVGNLVEASLKPTINPLKQTKGVLHVTGEELKDGLESSGIKKPHRDAADPAAERAAADAAATTQANARIAFQRKAMRDNSLLTGGGQSAASAGRTTLGV